MKPICPAAGVVGRVRSHLLIVDNLALENDGAFRGSKMQAITFRSVVFPEPEGPSRATTSPGATSMETCRKASMRVSPSPKCLEMPRKLTSCSGRGAKSMLSPPGRLPGPP